MTVMPRHQVQSALLLSLLILSAVAPPVVADAPFFQALGDLPGGEFHSTPLAVSADGSTVVGWSRGPEPGLPAPQSFRAFRWTSSEGMIELVDSASTLTFIIARDVSADGSVVVGECYDDGTGTSNVPCYWTATGGLTAIIDTSGTLMGVRTFGVSADGSVIVGTARSPTSLVAYRWTPVTGMQSLYPLPSSIVDGSSFGVSFDGSVITGQVMMTVPDVQPFRWTEQTGLVGLGDVPGGLFYALGFGISADGNTIVGGARTSFGSRDEAFIWTEASGYVLVDSLHGAEAGSTFYASSGDGTIVVGSMVGLGATIWSSVDGLRSLQSVLVNDYGLDLTGWTLYTARDCSSDGLTIAGTGLNPQGDTEAWIAHLGHPATAVGGDTPSAPTELAAWPNPLSGGNLNIMFGLESKESITAEIVVYDVAGRRVRTIARREFAGRQLHSMVWDGKDGLGASVSSGIYFVRVTGNSIERTRKIVVVR
jgi:uncharacterized membrane protein